MPLYSQPLTRKRSNLKERSIMAENVTKVPVKQEKIEKPSSTLQTWQPFEGLRDEIDRLFDDFGRGLWQPFRRSLFPTVPSFRSQLKWPTMPAVDVVEGEKAYEITAELPGMDEKNIDLRDHFPKGLKQLGRSQFDLIVNMSGYELPPEITTPVRRWDVPDPVAESFETHCHIRDEIESLVMGLILELRRRTS